MLRILEIISDGFKIKSTKNIKTIWINQEISFYLFCNPSLIQDALTQGVNEKKKTLCLKEFLTEY